MIAGIVFVAGRHRSLAQPGSAAMAHRCGRLFGEAVLAAAIAVAETEFLDKR